MSTFPKPRRKGWRFLRKGERPRKGDRYQYRDSEYDSQVDTYDIKTYSSGGGVDGPLFGSWNWGGYIRRIVKRRKKK